MVEHCIVNDTTTGTKTEICAKIAMNAMLLGQGTSLAGISAHLQDAADPGLHLRFPFRMRKMVCMQVPDVQQLRNVYHCSFKSMAAAVSIQNIRPRQRIC